MLFVKNMMFLDGAIATLAPDLDIFAEIAHISMYFAATHGERIAADVGIDPDSVASSTSTGVKASFGVDPDDRLASPTASCQARRDASATGCRSRTSAAAAAGRRKTVITCAW